MAGRVFVSGGSGYIAGFLIRQLVQQGWTVHTTVRDPAREAGLRELLAVDNAQLAVFAADLTRDAGWLEAMQGCSHVAHVASPLPGRWVKKPDDLIVPARDGVLRVLHAARAAQVRRFVMTSSVAAIVYGRGRGVHHFTESHWTPSDAVGASPYTLSKTLAERAARDWVAREGGGIEFCSINPSVVLGPVWGPDHSSSIALVSKLLSGSMRGCPDLGFGIVDVRDVADLHARALVAPGMAGERFIASGPFLKVIDIAASCANTWASRHGACPRVSCPTCWCVWPRCSTRWCARRSVNSAPSATPMPAMRATFWAGCRGRWNRRWSTRPAA